MVSAEGRPGRERWPAWMPAASVVVLVLLVYGRSVGFSFVGFDDLELVADYDLVHHPLARGAGALLSTPEYGYPVPLAVVTHHLDLLIAAGAPWMIHATNVALHAAVSLLVLGLLRAFGVVLARAWFGAALFAVHPIVAEPVCWAIGRKDLLAALFVLLGMTFHLRAVARSQSRGVTYRGPDIAALGACFVLAIASKPVGVVLPVLVLLESVASRRRPSASVWAFVFAALTASAALVVLSLRQQASVGALSHARATASETALFVTQHLALQLRDVAWPPALAPVYRDPLPEPFFSVWGIAGALSVVGVVLAGVASWRARDRAGLFGLGWTLVCFAPSCGIVALRRGPADSYFYLPLAGLALCLAHGLGRFQSVALRTELRTFVMGALVFVFAGCGWAQGGIWRSPTAFWGAQVATYPDDAWSNESLGDAFMLEHDPGDALRWLEHALELTPPEQRSLQMIDAVASGYARLGDPARAVRWYSTLLGRQPGALGASLRILMATRLEPRGPEGTAAAATLAAELKRCSALLDVGSRDRIRELCVNEMLDEPGALSALGALVKPADRSTAERLQAACALRRHD